MEKEDLGTDSCPRVKISSKSFRNRQVVIIAGPKHVVTDQTVVVTGTNKAVGNRIVSCGSKGDYRCRR